MLTDVAEESAVPLTVGLVLTFGELGVVPVSTGAGGGEPPLALALVAVRAGRPIVIAATPAIRPAVARGMRRRHASALVTPLLRSL